MWMPLIVLVLVGVLQACSPVDSLYESFHEQLVTYLRPGEPHIQDGHTLLNMLYVQEQLQVYCQRPTALSLRNVFQSSRLRLQIAAGGAYSQYKGATVREVHEARRQRNECFEGKPLVAAGGEQRIVQFPAHSHVCYGIHTDEPFALTLEVVAWDPERLAQFAFGLVLWLSSPLVADSLLSLYCSAAALGAHLAGVGVVAAAMLGSGGGRPLRLEPLKGNFKQVLEERPTLVALALVGGAWSLQSACQRTSFLWRCSLLRRLHYRLLRTTSYWLICTASDHSDFGRTCVLVLLPWPELWWLMNWLKGICARKTRLRTGKEQLHSQEGCQRQRAMGDSQDFLGRHPTSWRQDAQLVQPQISTRFLDGGSHPGTIQSGPDPVSYHRSRSLNRTDTTFRREQRMLGGREYESTSGCQYCSVANSLNRPSTWNCLNRRLTTNATEDPATRPSGSPEYSLFPRSSTTIVYSNANFSNSEPSPRDQ
ncbi:uncharacterized protein LOC108091575 [Drosophila ficusphila]|uniref:uncharacterized protein LOC108091575 n=1 Tax=Drosophila ficusphila TaxID=30025 RepID=UPI0007E843F8|nr:uncharacterized protein LOC108091575 [Drosophila ficusphila]